MTRIEEKKRSLTPARARVLYSRNGHLKTGTQGAFDANAPDRTFARSPRAAPARGGGRIRRGGYISCGAGSRRTSRPTAAAAGSEREEEDRRARRRGVRAGTTTTTARIRDWRANATEVEAAPRRRPAGLLPMRSRACIAGRTSSSIRVGRIPSSAPESSRTTTTTGRSPPPGG